jgi:hypothetical protein
MARKMGGVQTIAIALLTVGAVACGGGSEGGRSGTPPAATTQTGVFVDGPVQVEDKMYRESFLALTVLYSTAANVGEWLH